MFPHRGEVCRGLCAVIMYAYMFINVCICPCTRERVDESNWRAVSTVSRREEWEDGRKGGGSCVETSQLPNLLGLELSNSGWHQNNRQQTVSTASQTHILYCSACFHVCAASPLSCWSPAVSKGGSHVRGRAAKVSFLDQRLNSRDIMSFSVATLPLTAAHLPRHRNLDCGSPWQTVCLLQCVRMCLLS